MCLPFMVPCMPRFLAFVLIAGLLLLPGGLRAETFPAIAASPFDIPFDDVDPAVTQAEVTKQIDAFLQNLDAHWGKDRETIRGRVAGTVEREDGGTLVYARALAEHDVLEGYDFRDGSLVRGQYVVLQRPVNGLNEFIDYYAAVKQSLIASYGAPSLDQTIWDNDLYQPLPDYWGVAVQIGHLRYAASWDTAEGTISIELTGNHHSRLMVEYRSKDFVEASQTA